MSDWEAIIRRWISSSWRRGSLYESSPLAIVAKLVNRKMKNMNLMVNFIPPIEEFNVILATAMMLIRHLLILNLEW